MQGNAGRCTDHLNLILVTQEHMGTFWSDSGPWLSNKELNICVHSPTAVAELEMPHYGQDKTGPGGRCAPQSPVPWLVCPASSQCQRAPGPLARQICHVALSSVALNDVMKLAASPGCPKRPPWDTNTDQDLASAAQCRGSAGQHCLPISPRPFKHNLEALAAGARCAGEFNHCH